MPSNHLIPCEKVKVKITQLCLTIQSMEFSMPEYWSGWPFLSPGDLPNPGMETRSPALQADSLPAEPPGNVTLFGNKVFAEEVKLR